MYRPLSYVPPGVPPDTIVLLQALKANPEGAPKEFKVNANYLTKLGQVRGLPIHFMIVNELSRREGSTPTTTPSWASEHLFLFCVFNGCGRVTQQDTYLAKAGPCGLQQGSCRGEAVDHWLAAAAASRARPRRHGHSLTRLHHRPPQPSIAGCPGRDACSSPLMSPTTLAC